MTVRATFSEHDSEPVRGLPALLPHGERVLWQGAPDWRSLALHAYRLRELSVYFVLIVAARAAYLLASGATPETAVRGCLGPVVFSLISLGLLAAVAVFAARSTVYTITTRRVVVRQGIALASSVNLPFATIESADLRLHADGTGDLALQMNRNERISYLWLWPHVRPWRLTFPQPSLRSLPDAARAAEILRTAFLETLSHPDAAPRITVSAPTTAPAVALGASA